MLNFKSPKMLKKYLPVQSIGAKATLYSLCVLKRKEAKAQLSFFCGYCPTPYLVLLVVNKKGGAKSTKLHDFVICSLLVFF